MKRISYNGVEDNFINDLDVWYDEEKIKYKIDPRNKQYTMYKPIKVKKNGKNNNSFLIKKDAFTKFLYCKNGSRVYFSDADVLTMLLQIEKENVVDTLLDSLRKLYRGEGVQFTIYVNGKEYTVEGIEELENEQVFKNIKDIDISFADLLILINLIFAKDQASVDLWEPQTFFVKYTLSKYITLLEYYYKGNENAVTYLQKKGYDIEKSIYYNYNILRKNQEKDNYFNDFDLFESYLMV